MYRVSLFLLSLAALALPGSAQNFQRRANMVGGGNAGYGKCTAEVVVDGAAEVEIRGDTANLRNLNGQPPQWRRFECTSAMPANPVNFRFAGVDGRGRQQLVGDPRNGGAAVVRIEDPEGGAEGYTFDITWGGGAPNGQYGTPNGQNGGQSGQYGGQYGNEPGRIGARDRIGGGRFTADQAISTCQDAVRQQAINQFGARRVEFRDVRIDDSPGRNDWVIGRIEAVRGPGMDRYRFSCSVNFDTGRVRSVQVDPVGEGRGGNDASAVALSRCQRGVEERLRQDGYGRVEFTAIHVDDRPGRSDWVVGDARAFGRYGPERFDFSCSVELRDGDLRSVDVRRR